MSDKSFIHKSKVKDVKVSYNSILIVLLSFTLFFPFIPFDVLGGHEIIPLSVILLLFFFRTKKYLIPLTFSFVFSVCLALLLNLSLKTLFEFIQIIVVLSSLYLMSKISIGDLKKIERNIFRCSIVLIFYMLLQKIFPEHLQSITNIFSQRVMLVLDSRTGGVRGFAPEPAYMGSLIISFLMFSWWVSNRITLSRLLLYGYGVILTVSISATLTLLFLLLFQFIYRLFISRDIQFYKTKYILYLLILSAFLTATIDFGSVAIGMERMRVFLDLISIQIYNFDIKGALLAEEHFGSQRLKYLLTPLTEICCGAIFTLNYTPSYSLYGKFWAFFAPLHFFVILYFVFIKKMTAIRCVSLMLSIFYGPILFFLLYIGIVNQKSVTRSVNFNVENNRG